MSTPITVIVSGATGFIAQHVVKQLLAKNYQVIGTVRSTAKGDHLLKLFNNPKIYLMKLLKMLELKVHLIKYYKNMEKQKCSYI